MKNQGRYGLLTAMAMVTGTVIGSGVFFKTSMMLKIAGNGIEALSAWVIGGIIMIMCLLSFVNAVRICGNEDGLPGIARKTVGEGFSYYLGWFMAAIYFPAMTSVLAWLSSVYTLMTFGIYTSDGGLCMILACLFLVLSFMQNALFPVSSGKVQVVTTIFKLIPLVLMIVLGTIKGITSGILRENLFGTLQQSPSESSLWRLISSVMFAYEGWIASLGIGNELRNSKRNLSKALVLGGSAVVFVYVLYSLGIMGSAGTEVFLNYGNEGVKIAFSGVLGNRVASFLTFFVAISCLGALNGMMFSLGRAMYVISKTGDGPFPNVFSQIDSATKTPLASFTAGLIFSVIWLFLFFGISVSRIPLFGGFGFEVSEIPVITLYFMYIPIFVSILKMKVSKKVRFIISGGIISCVVVVAGTFFTHINDVADYMMVFVAVMLFGMACRKK